MACLKAVVCEELSGKAVDEEVPLVRLHCVSQVVDVHCCCGLGVAAVAASSSGAGSGGLQGTRAGASVREQAQSALIQC